MIALMKVATVTAIAVLCIMLYPHLNSRTIGAFINDNSVVAPLVFIALCAVKPVLIFLPSMGLTIVGGLLFGAYWGTVYVVIGGALSTLSGYYFARWLGRDMVKTLVEKNRLLKEIESKYGEHGKKTILYMRLFNLPWDMVSYWAGLSGIRFKDFYIASLIPLVPISFLYTYFGSRIFSPTSAGFIVSLMIIFIMGAIPYIRLRWKKRTNG